MTIKINFWQEVWNYFNSCEPIVVATIIVGIISTAAVLITGFFTIYFLRKQHQVQGLLEAFRILDTEQHTTSRTNIYALYFEYLDTGKLKSVKGSTDVQTC